MCKKSKLCSEVATLVEILANELMVELLCGGSLESGGQFCVGVFGRNLVSVAMKAFSYFIHFIKKFINFVLSMIFAKNATVNCITVQHKKDSSSSLALQLCKSPDLR
jgi:hypothetical protein